jgi:NADH dehydrogenase/NADH:ubiquinone oxidoreductase subunit G
MIMTRCIHCTRCVRFATEVAGVEEFGTTGRGKETEIGTYVEKVFNSELSGNVIDLCPVGALTSKPYAFMARTWELRSTESIDLSDSVGSNIRIDSRGTEILRILPRFNDEINEEWISDKTRFSYDGLKVQRLNTPYVKRDGKLSACGWEEALSVVANKLTSCDGSQIKGVLGNSVDSYTALAARDLFHKVGSSDLSQEKGLKSLDSGLTSSYRFNSSIAKLEDADVCLLVGIDTRYEASMINVRLRKRYLEGNFDVAVIGSPVDLTFDVQHLGTSKVRSTGEPITATSKLPSRYRLRSRTLIIEASYRVSIPTNRQTSASSNLAIEELKRYDEVKPESRLLRPFS